MDNRLLIPLTILCIIGLFGLLLLHFIPSTVIPATSSGYVQNVNVRGVAIEHRGSLYTLNFDQQNHLLAFLNQALPVSKSDYQKMDESLPFSKLVIYTFNAPDIEINPIGYREDNLVFFSPSWSASSYLIEISGGELKNLLSQTYDQ